jgi:hypothetical protein
VTADPASRPIGWWLKEADARLDSAFDRALVGKGRTRREWQVLSTLAARPTGSDELAVALAAFGPADAILGLVRALQARG